MKLPACDLSDTPSDRKRELLRNLLGQRHRERSRFPMSWAQQRLWFVSQLVPDRPLFNEVSAIRINYAFDVEALRRSLREVIRRHAILRTTFEIADSEPVQMVHPCMSVEMPVIDLRGLTPAERESQVQRLAEEEARRPFDLQAGPLLRATLYQLYSADFIFAMTTHHIVCDGWSLGILSTELTALYTAFVNGEPSPLPELPIQYVDFAMWERQNLTRDALQQQLAAWAEKLGDLPTLELPVDRRRPAVQQFHGAREPVFIESGLRAALEQLAHAEGATLFMVLLAAFQAMLHRYTGQDTIVVGSPVANRKHKDTERLIGHFVNTLVLKTEFADNPTFRELVVRVQQTAVEAYNHQDLPFEKLVELLRPRRDLSRHPLFQVSFQLFRTPSHLQHLARGVATDFNLPIAKFDLRFDLCDSIDALAGYIEYDCDLFLPETIVRMIAHFRTLLRSVADNPGARVGELPLLTETEIASTVNRAAAMPNRAPVTARVEELFENQARNRPGAIAVSDGDQRVTYAELSAQAHAIAARLRHGGVRPCSRVAIYLPRSKENIAATLGVLMAGAAYVPLDPEYPPARLRMIAADCTPAFILTRASEKMRVADWGVPILCVDEAAGTPVELAAARSSADKAAYIVYTSGSTGQPKGVIVPHRAIPRLVIDANYIQISPADRIAHAATCAFDAATFEIYAALLNGAESVMCPKETLLSAGNLARLLDASGITILFLSTDLFHRLVAEDPRIFGGLRYLIVGGSAGDPASVRKVLASRPPQHFLNAYGPTECTTFATMFDNRELPDDAAIVPLGRAISGTETWILDRYRNPVPAGIVGQLYLGGDGLALGYSGAPALTAERFVTLTLPDGRTARLYRTGDRVRSRPDGTIEFIGREDNQVKVRGYRVELDEIEATLGNNESVRQCTVTARRVPPGDTRLTAYVVPAAFAGFPGETNLIATLRAFLRERLPDHMIPTDFVLLAEMPLNANGKIDRQALPDPEDKPRASTVALPCTGTEHLIADAWRDVLQRDAIGVHDNFFDAGGHSLLLIQLQSRLEQRLGQPVPVLELLRNPTIASLASFFERQQQRRPNAEKQRDELLHPR